MTKKIAIYLAGAINKGHETHASFWTEDDIGRLRESFCEYEVMFLNPAFRMDNLADSYSVFGRDMTQVFCSHVVFVDARDRRGLGVGAEMMWAKVNRIPVVTWSPMNSHYNKTNTTVLGVDVDHFIHPFVYALSDKLVDTLEEGAAWIENMLSDPSIEIKDITHIHASMEYYRKNQLPVDLPMQEVLNCGALSDRSTTLCN